MVYKNDLCFGLDNGKSNRFLLNAALILQLKMKLKK
ncbi:hypothetical protein C8N25_101346 [Algoriphagus antarcticus]|uniref:Uncharacterized protein n=1 Tax=Algoriphagus antarcticus TaxID=238540 RepID=A0A3E0EBX3_9BACT|nr:hypothetical protein C8N25_101346 [Algoriphagus antarcticus]